MRSQWNQCWDGRVRRGFRAKFLSDKRGRAVMPVVDRQGPVTPYLFSLAETYGAPGGHAAQAQDASA